MTSLVRLWPTVCLAALLLTASGGGTAGAEDGEFYVNTYRGIGNVSPKGIRSVAMGGAGRALADGMNSLGVNPAALGAFQGTEFDAALGYDWLDDGLNDTDQITFRVGGAVNLDKWSNAAGANQAMGAFLHTQNFSDAGRAGMTRDQTAVLAGYGIHLMDDLLAGVSVALFNGKWNSSQQLDAAGLPVGTNIERKFTGGDFRVGGIYRLRDETTFGGTLGYATGSLIED